MRPIEAGCRAILRDAINISKACRRYVGNELEVLREASESEAKRHRKDRGRIWVSTAVSDGAQIVACEAFLLRIDHDADFLAEEAKRRTDEERSVKA